MARLLDDYFADAGAHQLSLKSRTLYRLALQSVMLPWAEREGIAEPAQLDPAADAPCAGIEQCRVMLGEETP